VIPKVFVMNRVSMKILTVLLVMSILLSTFAMVVPSLAFTSGVSDSVDYMTVEGVLHEDYYSSLQYGYELKDILEYLNDYKIFSTEVSVPDIDPQALSLKSLRIGFTEYGEFATPAYTGIAYGDEDTWDDTESFASESVNPVHWVQGWYFLIEYKGLFGTRAVVAFAEYSNGTHIGAARKCYVGVDKNDNDAIIITDNYAFGIDREDDWYEGEITPSGIKVLFEDARLFVARTKVRITDKPINLPVADIIFTIIFNKAKKFAVVLKDIKILLDTKVVSKIEKLAFSERYEIDLAAKQYGNTWSFVHYFKEIGTTVYGTYGLPKYLRDLNLFDYQHFDILQAIKSDEKGAPLFFAAYWPTATEFTVEADITELIPNPREGYSGLLYLGRADKDMAEEPRTPFVIVQWLSTSDDVDLTNLIGKQLRFVEVLGMSEVISADDDWTATSPSGTLYLEPEVAALVGELFNPLNLCCVSARYMFEWFALGYNSKPEDSAGVGFLAEYWSPDTEYYFNPAVLFDRSKPNIPWALQEFTNGLPDPGAGTYTYTLGDFNYALALLNFTFYVYDGDADNDPDHKWDSTAQPIAGGLSSLAYDKKEDYEPQVEEVDTDGTEGNGAYYFRSTDIATVGGPKANWVTRYYNDFSVALFREGTSGVYSLSIVDGTATGEAPTSDPTKDNLDIFPLTCWNVSVDTFGYDVGYAVVAITRDTNGSAGFMVWGWRGRDTFWASAWAAFWIGYVQNAGKSWLPDGTVALILKIDYSSDGEPSLFTVVEALGTVTELDLRGYLETKHSDWIGSNYKLTSELYEIPNPPWWFDKVRTTAVTATIHYDP